MTRTGTWIGLLLLLEVQVGFSQSLRDINFNHIYSASEEFSLNWKIIYNESKPMVYFEFSSSNASKSVNEYSIAWEVRKEIADKEGTPLPDPEWINTSETTKTGRVKLDGVTKGQVVVARVIYSAARKALYFQKSVPEAPPVVLVKNQFPVIATYIRLNEVVSISAQDPGKPVYLFFYSDDFPAAAPPFATAQAQVPKRIRADSTFVVSASQPLSFDRQGLYLVQQDTASATGLAFRVEDDYPKLGKLESLSAPLIYICTNAEMDKLRKAGGDKKQFDRIVLGITGDSERAKMFMRNYFRRVEQANALFSSYKEGWKTDRGMIHIICDQPDEVYLLGDREVWEYKGQTFKERFTFVKSPTVFDPDNFVLIRDKKFRDKWYGLIDLWRKARFK